MACKSLSLVVLFVLASLLSASVPNEAASSDSVSFRRQLDPKDPKVLEIADFAVKEHNKEAKTALKLISVVYAGEQKDPGTLETNYRLGITAADSAATNLKGYIAVLKSGPINKSLRLISFEPIED